MLLAEMNYLQVQDYLKTNDTVLIPVGSTENHGKHMPLGTDTLIPQRISELIEKELGTDIVIAPALPYGATQDLESFPGTVSIGVDGLTLVLTRICDDLFDDGFRRFIILNGHGGNSKAIEAVGLHLYKRGGLLARIDWWLNAGELNEKWHGGHGGAEETAGVMAFDEHLIKREYLYEGENVRNDLCDELPSSRWTAVRFQGALVTVPRPLRSVTDNGHISYGIAGDEPFNADPVWGREMLETTAKWVCGFVGAFRKAKLPDVTK